MFIILAVFDRPADDLSAPYVNYRIQKKVDASDRGFKIRNIPCPNLIRTGGNSFRRSVFSCSFSCITPEMDQIFRAKDAIER